MPLLLADPLTAWLIGGIGGVLILASIACVILRLTIRSEGGRATVANITARTVSWWLMALVLLMAMALGHTVSVILFAGISFLALREFLTISPTHRSDHRSLFWCFFVIIPLQYLFVGIGWIPMVLVFIPVWCFLFLPVRAVSADDPTDFLGRTSKIQWGLMVCVFCISHVPALLSLPIVDTEALDRFRLVILLVVLNQGCDVLQYIWGKTLGRHPILPTVSPNKTWEGLIGGVLSTGLLGIGLAWATPFTWWQAGCFGLGIGVLGFFGDVVMSAIKRDAGVKDYGNLIGGHGGLLDRIDSLCFAAPVFFHLLRFYYTV